MTFVPTKEQHALLVRGSKPEGVAISWMDAEDVNPLYSKGLMRVKFGRKGRCTTETAFITDAGRQYLGATS